jgi:hypothetical protein
MTIGVLRHEVQRFDQGVRYFQNGIRFHSTHTQAMSFTPIRKVRPPVSRFSRNSQRLRNNMRRSLIPKFTQIGHYMWKARAQNHLHPLANVAFTAAIFTKLTITQPIFANTTTNFLFNSAACTVRSESRCILRLRYVDLVASIEVVVEVCCCFTVFSC